MNQIGSTGIERKTITIHDAAVVLGVSDRHAYDLATRGELPGAFRLGDRWLVVRRRLLAFLDGEVE